MIKLFEQCPACGGPIVITECRCANCQLQMRGEFRVGTFSSLSDDQLTFIRAFLRVRGNQSEMEKVLGVSYPTIRNKLDEINKTLDRAESGQPADKTETPAKPIPAEEQRRAILQQVAAGQLPAAEALDRLRSLQGGE